MIGTRFVDIPVQESVVEELSARAATNPFATKEFFESKRRMGCTAWVLGLTDDAGELTCGCGAFLTKGKLDRALEIASLPAVRADSSFWSGLREFCARHGVTKLELDTFGSPQGAEIPVLGRHCTARNRSEFVLDLSGDLAAMLNSNHRRNFRKAQKAGLTVRRTRSAEAADVHRALMNESIERRRARGENLPPSELSLRNLAFLDSGAGELFQALHGTTAVSSVLVLSAPKGSYYQSAGTSSEGMAIGASHFLIHSIAQQLRAEGAQIFNLGGADETSSLERFKEGFGASRVRLPSASCYVGPSWRLAIGRAIAFVRSSEQRLPRLIDGRFSRVIVYAIDTKRVGLEESRADLGFRKMTPEDLHGLSDRDISFRERQLDRLNRFGASYAYAVVAEDHVAHISWLLPHTAMQKDPPRVLRARANEAEITCCETLPAFRGRGIYRFAIHKLIEIARGQGVHRVWMKTTPDNKASQSGIEKAGLQRLGAAILILLPLTERLVIWRRFR